MHFNNWFFMKKYNCTIFILYLDIYMMFCFQRLIHLMVGSFLKHGSQREWFTEADDNWPAVVINLRKSRRKWARLKRFLGREGVDARTLGQVYLVVVQSVFLYGSETWVINPRIRRLLGRFNHRVACRMK